MVFVLVVAVVVFAGWVYMAVSANRGNAQGSPRTDSNDHVPVNAYDNPYETNENNDRPFEPDTCSDASENSTSDGQCDAPGDTGSSD